MVGPDRAAAVQRRRVLAASLLQALLAGAAAARAERTVRLVTGFPAGAGADAVARMVSERLRPILNANVLVESMPGAGARIAIEHVRTAPADGSALLLVPDATMFLYAHVYKSLTYDPVRDFTPLARLVSLSLAMFVGPMVPARIGTVAAYIDWARSDASRWIYGTSAPGATPHFAGAMFAHAAGLQMNVVHYQGGAPGIQDLAGGHLPVFFGAVADGIGLLAGGRIRALATTGSARVAALGNIPTFSELGYRDLLIEDGLGVHAPIKLPPAVGVELSAALLQSLQSPEVNRTLRQRGFDVAPEGPQEFAQRLQRERARWGPLVRSTGFTAIE